MIGKTVSHYKILEHLGGGGMGVVYKAQDLKLDRPVALKFLPPDLTRDPEAKQRFIHEAQAASSLDHPNICDVHDIGETEEGQIFIVMAYYEGETLKKKIERGPLKIGDALDIANQVAQGLTKAHEHGITHRDIKPANIMITADGVPKVVDFGLAKLSGRTMLTKTGSTLGTAAYMSPEQARGEPADHRTDIWSLGVVLYEMLTGKRPFEADYENALLYSILNAEPEPITGIRTGISMELERIVQKCLQKLPSGRYQHMDELALDLRGVSQVSTTGRKLPITEGVPSSPKRRATAFILGALVLAGTLAVTWWLLKGSVNHKGTEGEIKSIAVLPFPVLGAGEDARMFADGIHGEILSRLTKIKGLKVKGQTSVLQYRDTKKRLRDIGEELGVDFLMEGSVHRAGDRVRVQAQLIDAETEDHVWADTYDRPFDNILDIESSISQRIAIELNAILTPKERRLVEQKPTENLEAYEYYLKGLYYWKVPYSNSGNDIASQMFQKAVSLDSNFALAQAWLSIVEMTQSIFSSKSVPERVQKAKHALHCATSLNSDLAEVHVAKATYAWYIERDSANAWKEFEAALENQPNNSEVLYMAGAFLLHQGAVEQALGLFLKVYELDPIINIADYVATCNLYLRRYNEAERWGNTMVSRTPSDWLGYEDMFVVAVTGFGDFDKANRVMDEARKAMTEKADLHERWMRFPIAFYQRDYQEALRILDSGAPVGIARGFQHLQRAQLHELLGSHREAKKYLDSAIVESGWRWDLEPTWGSLAVVYAMQGKREAALREMAKALRPGAKIWNWGREAERRVAEAWIALGEYDRAIDQLEHLLTVPSVVTKARLRLDPIYDPLRNNPRFQALMMKDEQM